MGHGPKLKVATLCTTITFLNAMFNLRSSHPTDVHSSVRVSVKFGLKYVYDATKMGWNSWGWLAIGRAYVSARPRLHSLRLQMTTRGQRLWLQQEEVERCVHWYLQHSARDVQTCWSLTVQTFPDLNVFVTPPPPTLLSGCLVHT